MISFIEIIDNFLCILVFRFDESLYSARLTGTRVHAWNDVDDNDYVDRIPALIGTCNQSKARNIRSVFTRLFHRFWNEIFLSLNEKAKLVKQLGAIIPLFETANSISSDDRTMIQYWDFFDRSWKKEGEEILLTRSNLDDILFYKRDKLEWGSDYDKGISFRWK